jgi:hypothetical protein
MGGPCPYTQQSTVIGAVKPFAGWRGAELSDKVMQTLTECSRNRRARSSSRRAATALPCAPHACDCRRRAGVPQCGLTRSLEPPWPPSLSCYRPIYASLISYARSHFPYRTINRTKVNLFRHDGYHSSSV